MFVLHKIQIETGTITTFSSLIIFGISETRAVSFDAVLCMFWGSSNETNSV